MTAATVSLLAAPLTFDPSIVELEVALQTGATLVVCSDAIKQVGDQVLCLTHARLIATQEDDGHHEEKQDFPCAGPPLYGT